MCGGSEWTLEFSDVRDVPPSANSHTRRGNDSNDAAFAETPGCAGFVPM
jgi:hypothetical protein